MLLRAKPFPVPFFILVHSTHIYLPMKMEQTVCSETSAYKLQTPGNYPKESIQQSMKVFVHMAEEKQGKAKGLQKKKNGILLLSYFRNL